MNFIKNIKLPKIIQRHPMAFSVAIALHIVVFIGLLFSNLQHWDKTKEKAKNSTPRFIPKAVTIDLSEIKKEKQRLLNIQKNKALKLKNEERHLRELEDKRYKKQRKINQLKAKAKKEKQAKKQAEKKRKKIEKQAKLEAEKFKQEQRKYTLAKQAQLRDEEKRKIAQEAVIKELKLNYINQIASRVRSQWRYQGAKDSWSCIVYILQDKGGNVEKVDLKSCNIDDKSKVKSFKNAINRAVKKASPLPAAPDKSVFERKIIFHFRVN